MMATRTIDYTPIERAAIAFVKLIEENDMRAGGDAAEFGSDLFEDERLAWHDLTAAVAGDQILYG